VAALPGDERAEVLEQLAAVLDRHAVGGVKLSYVAQLRHYARP
jgi:hypothetical protein